MQDDIIYGHGDKKYRTLMSGGFGLVYPGRVGSTSVLSNYEMHTPIRDKFVEIPPPHSSHSRVSNNRKN
jgi:hypothetical protein